MSNHPISIINHTSVIPKNNSSYRETFNTIMLPTGNVYKITSITCKIDTTSLWNITSTNVMTYINSNDQTVTISLPAGYYSLTELCSSLGVITVSNNRASVNNTCQSCDFTDAPDIANILKFDRKSYTTGSTSDKPVDITNNKAVIKIYSSIMQQTFGIKSSFCDSLIHVTTGLNNVTTQDNLDISVANITNWDHIEWSLCDAADKPISLNSNVYINFTISVYPKL